MLFDMIKEEKQEPLNWLKKYQKSQKDYILIIKTIEKIIIQVKSINSYNSQISNQEFNLLIS